MKEKKEYYFLPLEDCLERISECLQINKIIKSYIKDNVENEDAWQSSLMTLLTEYYAISCRYTELMNELVLTPPSHGDEGEEGEEIITVDAQKYAILTSYSKLMLVNEVELKHKHRVHLFLH
tara:strand:+ start:4351 stop:4716 length:366 start_codon:yes stop_codon:yes gene_type:complete